MIHHVHYSTRAGLRVGSPKNPGVLVSLNGKKCPGMKKSTIFVREYVVGLVDDPKQCCDLPVGSARKAESALAHAPDADGVAKFYEL